MPPIIVCLLSRRGQRYLSRIILLHPSHCACHYFWKLIYMFWSKFQSHASWDRAGGRRAAFVLGQDSSKEPRVTGKHHLTYYFSPLQRFSSQHLDSIGQIKHPLVCCMRFVLSFNLGIFFYFLMILKLEFFAWWSDVARFSFSERQSLRLTRWNELKGFQLCF